MDCSKLSPAPAIELEPESESEPEPELEPVIRNDVPSYYVSNV